jgi:hypothetical protein
MAMRNAASPYRGSTPQNSQLISASPAYPAKKDALDNLYVNFSRWLTTPPQRGLEIHA